MEEEFIKIKENYLKIMFRLIDWLIHSFIHSFIQEVSLAEFIKSLLSKWIIHPLINKVKKKWNNMWIDWIYKK